MSPQHPCWTTLPPIPLRGVGTSMVESLDHYVHRMAWTVGISRFGLIALSGASSAQAINRRDSCSTFSGLSTYSESRIFGLESLTGVEQLRHGTLWVLKDVAGKLAFGRSTHLRRWCPVCYKQWSQESWEPLIWAVQVLSLCPIHGCALESLCPACGAPQSANTAVARRRTCGKCLRDLGGSGRRPTQSGFMTWVDRQVGDVIELCATPGLAPVRADSFSIYMESLVEQAKGREKVPAILSSHIRNTRHNGVRFRPSIRTMINMCALQGVSVLEMLLSPEGASSAPLLDLWNGYSVLPFGPGPYGSRAGIVAWLLRKVIAKCRGFYLPPMECVLTETGFSRSCMRELNVDLYEHYESLYRAQAGPTMTYRLAEAFCIALGYLSTVDTPRLVHTLFWTLPKRVAPVAHLSSEEAEPACWSAVLYLRLARRAKERSENAYLDAMEDPPWLHGASE